MVAKGEVSRGLGQMMTKSLLKLSYPNKLIYSILLELEIQNSKFNFKVSEMNISNIPALLCAPDMLVVVYAPWISLLDSCCNEIRIKIIIIKLGGLG